MTHRMLLKIGEVVIGEVTEWKPTKLRETVAAIEMPEVVFLPGTYTIKLELPITVESTLEYRHRRKPEDI